MIAEGLFTRLTQDATVSALVAARVYPLVLPDAGAFPAITYQQIGGSSAATLNTSGMQRARLQIDCWSAPLPQGGTYRQAAALRDAVIGALNGWQGTFADGTAVSNIVLLGPGTDFFVHEALQYRCMVEFYLLYTFTN
jgi:hypothetical protein